MNQDEDLARQLIELGYRGSGEALKKDEFDAKKRELDESNKKKTSRKPKSLSSSVRSNYAHCPFLAALAEREENVRNGKLTSMIFIRHTNPRTNQEISGYIDYAHRLKQEEDFTPYFRGDKKLYPRQSDLSYYNWATQTSTSNSTPNFQVKADNPAGLLFKNRRDRKIINVDPRAPSGDNTVRTPISVSISRI